MLSTVNPYIAGSPVTGSEMFFGREDVFTFIHQALIGKHRDNIIVLYGQRRTGKTSTFYRLPTSLGSHYLCVFIDLQALQLQGIDGFLWELANQIRRVLQREYQIELPALERNAFMGDARTFFQHTFLDQIWPAIGNRHLLLMLDEAIRLEEQVRVGRMESQVFEYLSHLMQHYERLNFLFSLGSGLEEMEREYALLFRTAVYKKISFLSRDETMALIVNPVKEHYKIALAAQERIFQITSGHPYCTQLLCHSLFNRWQRHPTGCITISDVEAVLDEVVERGLAVFKYVWEESNPAEKAVMVAIASITSLHQRPANCNDIIRVWRSYNVCLPPGEIATALRSLTARDVIKGEDAYTFTISLQRRWIQKYQRFDWIGEEIAENMHEWRCSTSAALSRLGVHVTPPRSTAMNWRARLLLVPGLIIALIFMIGSPLWVINYLNDQNTSSAAIISRHQHLEDPLLEDSGKYGWDDHDDSSGYCRFSQGYHIFTNTSGAVHSCVANLSNFQNFTFEVEMNIKRGRDKNAAGGLVFRSVENNGQGYGLLIDTQGNYAIYRKYNISKPGRKMAPQLLFSTQPAKSFYRGFNQANRIRVNVKDNIISLYVNNHFVVKCIDEHHTYSNGQIGFLAGLKGTEVVYTKAHVQELP